MLYICAIIDIAWQLEGELDGITSCTIFNQVKWMSCAVHHAL